jgi:hypothetical protein
MTVHAYLVQLVSIHLTGDNHVVVGAVLLADDLGITDHGDLDLYTKQSVI